MYQGKIPYSLCLTELKKDPSHAVEKEIGRWNMCVWKQKKYKFESKVLQYMHMQCEYHMSKAVHAMVDSIVVVIAVTCDALLHRV